MEHCFSKRIAKQVGTKAAVIYAVINGDIKSDCETNTITNDVRWMKCSIDKFHEICPYLTKHQIANAIKKLEDSGLIFSTTKFNHTGYDHTKWYSVKR